MPPNLGGFFMVRSYYPSECHADYFDFERIEALKPAIEACGISTLSQSLFFFQAEDGIRDHCVTGVQTCALPIFRVREVDLVDDRNHGESLSVREMHVRYGLRLDPLRSIDNQ